MYSNFGPNHMVYMIYSKLPSYQNVNKYCLSFWYFMSGTVGTLYVQVQQLKGETAPLWIRQDNYGPAWIQGEIEFTNDDLPDIQVYFLFYNYFFLTKL